MITSDRKFGVEIEFLAPTLNALNKIRQSIHVVSDGSLRPLRNAGEWVSQPMIGKKGEETVRQACAVLNKYKASGDNPKTSVHVHLDGRVSEGVLKSARKQSDSKAQIAISNTLKKTLGVENIMHILRNKIHRLTINPTWNESTFDDVLFLSKANLTRKPKLNYTYYWLDKDDRFKWLRNVLYFYVKYSDVMEGLVSSSRKFGNMYCVPLGSSYSLEDIENATTMDDLKKVWYKGGSMSGHYNDSRYHDVNLHSFWDRHGTVEIRSHGGTTDPDKILLWLKLHQKIVDKLEDIEIEELKLINDTPLGFVRFIEEPMLQDYVKRLLGFYSGVNVK